MTKQEILEAIANGEANEETIAFAEKELQKLATQKARNSERAAEKKEKFNTEVRELVGGLEVDRVYTASEVADLFGMKVQRASSIMRRAVELELANAEAVLIKGKGAVKGYTIL